MSSSESNSSNTNPFLSSSSSDGELQAYYNQWQSTCQQLQQAVQQGGDNAQPESSRRRRRRTHIERGREQGHSQLYKDYFSEIATYPDEVFRRRFRMRKPLFVRIVEQLEGGMQFFQQRPDATGRFAFQHCKNIQVPCVFWLMELPQMHVMSIFAFPEVLHDKACYTLLRES